VFSALIGVLSPHISPVGRGVMMTHFHLLKNIVTIDIEGKIRQMSDRSEMTRPESTRIYNIIRFFIFFCLNGSSDCHEGCGEACNSYVW